MISRPIGAAVDKAVGSDLDLLSLSPRHELGSFAERLLLPCGHYFLAFAQDLRWIQSDECRDAVATGQFMLLRRSAYAEVGGHAAVRNSICEDVELARLIKRRKGRVLLLDGSGLLRTRMYTGWKTLWPGLAKNITHMLGGPARTLAMVLSAVALSWAALLIPAVDLATCLSGSNPACLGLAPALAGSLAAIGFHIAGAGYFGIPLGYGLLFPLGYLIGALIALDGLRWRLTGRVQWKGRVYQ